MEYGVWGTEWAMVFDSLSAPIIGTVSPLDILVFGIAVLVTVVIARVVAIYLEKGVG